MVHSIALATAVAHSPWASGGYDPNFAVQKGWQHGSPGSQGNALCCENVVVWSPAQCNKYMMCRHLKVAQIVWADDGFYCIAGMMPRAYASSAMHRI